MNTIKTAGIISEYNPFHNGHKFHINKTKQAGYTHIVSVMSGSMVQRGDIACFDKWTRTQVAIANGVDLTIELPTVNVLSSAKRFAESSVYLLSKLNVDAISFGSEAGDIDLLKEIAEISVVIESSDSMVTLINQGLTYPQALTHIMQNYGDLYSTTLANPNNLLAIEYIKAVDKFSPKMELFTVKREQADHDSLQTGETISSASFIRKNISRKNFSLENQFIPEMAGELYDNQLNQGFAPILLSNIERAILIKLRQMSSTDFLKLADVSNGLENRLVKSAQTSTLLDEFYLAVKSKSCTHARIRRIVMNAFLDIDNDLTCTLPQYARILGMSNNGKEILKALKKSKTDFAISPKFATLYKEAPSLAKKLLDIDIKATDISSIASQNILSTGLDFTRNTIIM